MAVRGAQVVYNSSLLFAQQYALANYNQGIVGQSLINGVLTGGTPNMIVGSSTLPVQWEGGRTMISFEGNIPPGMQLQQLLPSGSWVQVGSGTFPTSQVSSGVILVGMVTPQVFSADTAQGQYRVFNSGSGAYANTYIQMTAIPYGL
jgi:hypothetical protein